MEYRSSDVMAYLLSFCRQSHIETNKTKLQKLLYCCYGAILAKFDARLTDEHPKAWPYGPVFPRTFNDISKHRLTEDMAVRFRSTCNEAWLSLMHKTIVLFGQYNATQLSNWSHMKGSPWDKAEMLSALDDREIAIFFKSYLPIIEGN